MQLVFATHNKHKVGEIKPLVSVYADIVTLDDIGCNEEIPETGQTLEANALQKAMYVYERYHCNCFADDTGLEVNALNGEPGVFSARYAGEGKSASDNIEKLLRKMSGVKGREAVFRTVITLILNGKPLYFEGHIKGSISEERKGNNGFGYDPVFIPDGYTRSFAEMTLEEKNQLSHRAMAVKSFVEFITKLPSSPLG